jgi:hypothetical protein
MAFEPNDPNAKRRWWRWWQMFGANKHSKRPDNPSLEIASKTSLKDWQKMLDMLQPIIRSMRNDIDDLNINDLSFDILGAGTFLLQIDLLLIKIRQHYNNFDRRAKELNLSIPQLEDIMDKVQQNCQMCYINMRDLHALLRTRTYSELNHKEVINQVHALESETKSLTESMHALNEMALKRDPLYQLFENELFKTMMELEQGHRPLGTELNVSSTNTTSLRDKAHNINAPEMRKIAFNLISYYETLRRCSILYQSPQVTKSLDSFKTNMKQFLGLCTQEEAETHDCAPNDAMQKSILAIFFDLEAMRFTRFKGYQDKARTVKKQLQQTLKQSEFGIECLKVLQMSPRAKLSLKSRL